LHETPNILETFRIVPLKTPTSTKCTIFDAFCTKCIRDGVPCTIRFVRDSKVLPNALGAVGVFA